MNKETKRRCRWRHRWPSIEEAEWVGGIAAPTLKFMCRRCGQVRYWRAGL